MIASFLLFLTGVDRDALTQCPSERGKYVSLGAIMLVLSVLATLGGTHLADTFGLHWPWNVALGVFWGITVWLLDRLILVSWREMRTPFQDFLMFGARLLLATVLSCLINLPLQLYVFRPEVALRMETERQQRYSEARRRLEGDAGLLGELAQIDREGRELTDQLRDKDVERQRFYRDFVAEAEGTGGSLTHGRGPVFREKKEQYDRSNGEYLSLRRELAPRVEALRKRRAEFEESKRKQLGRFDTAQGSAMGIAQQVKCLCQLVNENQSMLLFVIPMNLALLLLDIIPVLVKFQGTYHKRKPLETLIAAKQAEEDAEAHLRLFEVDCRVTQGREEITNSLLQQQLSRRRIMEQLQALDESHQVEFGEEAIRQFYSQHLDQLRTNPSQYVSVN